MKCIRIVLDLNSSKGDDVSWNGTWALQSNYGVVCRPD